MTELADLLPSERPDFVAFRRGRVISVSGRSVKVDLGTLEVTVPAADSCYPIPGQTVLLSVEGSTMTAIAALGGVNKQPTVVVVSSTSTTVTGTVNGSSRVMPKAGLFDVVAGDELPLFWAQDGSEVWVGGKAGTPYVPPPPSGGGGGGGGGGVTSGTATYPANFGGTYLVGSGRWASAGVMVSSSGIGAFFYGASRFRELQGRTITGMRARLERLEGSGGFNVYGHPHAGPPASTASLAHAAGPRAASGWVSLPLSLASYLISGSGTGGLTFSGGSGQIKGTPSGTLQFDWQK